MSAAFRIVMPARLRPSCCAACPTPTGAAAAASQHAEGVLAQWMHGVPASSSTTTACSVRRCRRPTPVVELRPTHTRTRRACRCRSRTAAPPARQGAGHRPADVGRGARARAWILSAFSVGARCSRLGHGHSGLLAAHAGERAVLFFDEPAGARRSDDPPLERELAHRPAVGGGRVLRHGRPRLRCRRRTCRFAAGPDVVHLTSTRSSRRRDRAEPVFDGGGWIAWGAAHDGPIGEHPSPLWKSLLDVW